MSDILTLASKNTALVYDTLNQVDHMVFWTDINSKQIIANEKFIKLTGYNGLDDMHGTFYYDQKTESAAFHNHWVLQDKNVLQSCAEEKLISYLQLAGTNTRSLYYAVKSPAFDKSGNIIGITQVCIDITSNAMLSFIPLINSHDQKHLIGNDKGAFTYRLNRSFCSCDQSIKLTPRQSECLFFILRGKSAKEIGKILNISHRVVEHHTTNIHIKFRTHSKSQLIEKAIQLGFTGLIPTNIIKLLTSIPFNA